MNKLHLTKKRVVFIGIIALILAIAAYGWASASTWISLESKLTMERKQFETLQAEVSDDGPREQRLAAIRELDDKVGARSELCAVSPLYEWQSNLVPQIKSGLEQCKQAVDRLDELARPLKNLREYLDVAEKVESSVKKLVTADELNESSWRELGLGRAEAVQKELEQIDTANGDAAELRDAAQTLSNKLVKSWRDLIDANDKRDVNAFLQSSENVASSYAAFAGLADEAEATIQTLASKVSTVVETDIP